MVVSEVTTTESFPTVCRSTCFGVCVTMGRLTTCVATFASLLVRANPLGLPAAVAALNGVAAALVWMLEETKGTPMPQTVEELEERKRNRIKTLGGKNKVKEGDMKEVEGGEDRSEKERGSEEQD